MINFAVDFDKNGKNNGNNLEQQYKKIMRKLLFTLSMLALGIGSTQAQIAYQKAPSKLVRFVKSMKNS